MDEKTVIIRPEPPAPKKVPAKKPVDAKIKDKPPEPKPQKSLNFPIVILLFISVILVGVGSALTSIFFFSSHNGPDDQVTAQELTAELVAVETPDEEAQDEALVRDAITPRIINLSGDPVVVRQLSTARRQSVRLDRDSQKKAASQIGVPGDVFRIKDTLDTPNDILPAGLAGSQEDIATLSDFQPAPSDDKASGSSMVDASQATDGPDLREFAQEVKAKSSMAAALAALGAALDSASKADAAFAHYYGSAQLNPHDKLAVRALAGPNAGDALTPVQVSVYSNGNLVGSIALDDIEHYVQAADPWAGEDIFKAELLPQDVKPEERPRLLDAIYATMLRNRLPTAVTGEAIMLLSRAQDLEQKTQAGDTVTLVYSPAPRDAKTGLGRIVYVSIGRTTGNLECYAFQAEAGAAYDCVSGSGESSMPQNGMTLPVSGVIVAKFGPQQTDSGAANNMNFGVDWSAPEGTPVLAAYEGRVQSIGPEGSYGLVLRLTHADNKSSMYAYLQRAEAGLVVGSKVTAGQVIGYVGVPQSSRSARLHFELRENDVPVDPLPEAQPSAGGGAAVDQFVHRIITIESGNLCTARNPLSTAVGLGQFIESTWMTTIRIHRPDLLVGRSRQQVLDMRLDCNLSRSMTAAFTRDNAAVLRRAGASVTPGNLYLAHFLGSGGAVKAVAGSSDRLISDVFGAAHVRANPFEAGKSVGFLVSWAARKMSGASAAPPKQVASNDPNASKAPVGAAPAAADAASATPMASYDANPAFTTLKNAVLAFLQ